MKQVIYKAAIVFISLSIFFLQCKRNPKNKLLQFIHDKEQTFVEIQDSLKNVWKVHFAIFDKITVQTVLDKKGQIASISFVIYDSLNHTSFLTMADSSLMNESKSVLNKGFLNNLSNASEEYKTWITQNILFDYTKRPQAILLSKSGLGNGTVSTEGNKIIARWKNAKCHCDDIFPPFPLCLISTWSACLNSFCDLVNCIGEGISNLNVNCREEAERAKTACNIAVALDPQ